MTDHSEEPVFHNVEKSRISLIILILLPGSSSTVKHQPVDLALVGDEEHAVPPLARSVAHPAQNPEYPQGSEVIFIPRCVHQATADNSRQSPLLIFNLYFELNNI